MFRPETRSGAGNAVRGNRRSANAAACGAANRKRPKLKRIEAITTYPAGRVTQSHRRSSTPTSAQNVASTTYFEHPIVWSETWPRESDRRGVHGTDPASGLPGDADAQGQ
jgi:hypothetical protein